MSASANIRAGRAYVEVTAETSKLRANLNAAQSQLRDFGSTNVEAPLLSSISPFSVVLIEGETPTMTEQPVLFG